MNVSYQEIRSALSVAEHNAADLARRVAALERLCGYAAERLLGNGPKVYKATSMTESELIKKLRAAAEGKEFT